MALQTNTVSPISLYANACNRQFDQLCALFEDQQRQAKFNISHLQICDGYGQFKIWAGNIGALQSIQSPSSLDYRLREVPKVSKQIVALLEDLDETLEDICAIASGKRSNRVSSLITLDNVEILPSESGINGTRSVSVSTEQVSGPASEILELFQSIAETITSLFKLSILIRNSSSRDRYVKALAAASKGPFNDQFDVDHVGNKFPRLYRDEMTWMRIRLGKAITQRRQYLRYCREHHDKMAVVPETSIMAANLLEPKAVQGQHPRNDDDTRKLMSKPTSTLAPTTASTIIAAKLDNISKNEEPSDDDTRSQTSYATSVSEGDSDNRLSVVRLEDVALGDSPFECPYCWTIQTISNQHAWRKHVMRDLKPYVCTFEECDVKLFPDRHTWFTHELQTHRVEWRCCFCTHVPYQSLPIFQKHIQIHTSKFTEDRLPAIVKICQQPLDRLPATACPFCDDWELKLREVNKHISSEEILAVTPQQFRHHVGGHMEQLALFAIPRGYKEDGDAESGRAVPGHGSDASPDRSLVRPDFEDHDNPRIHVAAFEGQEDEVKELLGPELNPEVLYSRGKTWGSVLAAAVAGGRLSIADFLLKRREMVTFTSFPQTSKRWTSLHWAASNGNLAMTKLLLDHAKSDTVEDIDIRLVRNRDVDGLTALDLARQHGHDDVVKMLEESYSESTDVFAAASEEDPLSDSPNIRVSSKSDALSKKSRTKLTQQVKDDLWRVLQRKDDEQLQFACREDLEQIWSATRVEQLSAGLDWAHSTLRELAQKEFRKVMSTLVWIEWDDWHDFGQLFLQHRRTDGRLERSDDWMPLEDTSFLRNEELRALFQDQQHIFSPVLILEDDDESDDIHYIQYSEKQRMPFIQTEKIGRGGFGVVTKELVAPGQFGLKNGTYNTKALFVARKRVPRGRSAGSKVDASFLAERKIIDSFRRCLQGNKNIMLSYTSFAHGPDFTIISPLADLDLDTFFEGEYKDFPSRSRGFTPSHLLYGASCIAGALSFLHEGLQPVGITEKIYCAHLNLKPQNILVVWSYTEPVGRWLVHGFGTSMIGEKSPQDLAPGDFLRQFSLIHPQRPPGTFQAPEVERTKEKVVGVESDLWSLGCIVAVVLAFAIGGPSSVTQLAESRAQGGFDDYFYERKENRSFLKDNVVKWLDSLDTGRSEDAWIKETLSLIYRILVEKLTARPSARKVQETLCTIYGNVGNDSLQHVCSWALLK